MPNFSLSTVSSARTRTPSYFFAHGNHWIADHKSFLVRAISQDDVQEYHKDDRKEMNRSVNNQNRDADDRQGSPALSQFIQEMKINTDQFVIVADNPRTHLQKKMVDLHRNSDESPPVIVSDKRSSRWLADGEIDRHPFPAMLFDTNNNSNSNHRKSKKTPINENHPCKIERSRIIQRSYSDQSGIPRLPQRQLSDTSLDSLNTKRLSPKEHHDKYKLKSSASGPIGDLFLPLPQKDKSNRTSGKSTLIRSLSQQEKNRAIDTSKPIRSQGGNGAESNPRR